MEETILSNPMETSETVVELEQTTADDWNGVDEIESVCMNCGESGMTRLMIHKIPHFRELILASFRCEHCGENNNEVRFG
jgi:zinc finger protein